MPIRSEPTVPPRASSVSSRKRLRPDGSDDEALANTSAAPKNDGESLQDMWDGPPEVSRHAWAVTRCLDDHGNSKTRWSPAHFVAVSMWYGGITAGIQAAKAIRVFGIWSPHVEGQHGGLPPVDDDSDKSYILDKLWPTVQANRSLLVAWAGQSTGIPFPNFTSAHHHLLRECIGPDLTRFPTVVRPKMKSSQYWEDLVDEEQFENTLAPVLRKYFDHRVDLDSVSRKIVGYGTNPTSGQSNFGNSQIAKADGLCGTSRGINKERNLFQTDNNQDDEEDFSGSRPTRSGTIKKESGLSSMDSPKSGRECNITPNQVLLDMKEPKICANNLYRKHNDTATYSDRTGAGNGRPSIVGPGPTSGIYNTSPTSDVINNALPNIFSQPHPYYNGELLQAARTSYQSPYESQPSANSTMGKPAASYLTNQRSDGHDVAHALSSDARDKQDINTLYEKTRDIPREVIQRFAESNICNAALCEFWFEVWNHKKCMALHQEDRLPYPSQALPVKNTQRSGHQPRQIMAIQGILNNSQPENIERDLKKLRSYQNAVNITDSRNNSEAAQRKSRE